VRLPVGKAGESVVGMLSNAVYDVEGAERVPDISKYKVPKITYPKLDFTAYSKKTKDKVAEVKE